MLGRLLAITLVAGCYTPPQPDCGFACGPGGACPEDYTCNADNVCHRNGSPASLICRPDAAVDAPLPDAPSPPADAPPDAPDTTPPVLVETTPANGATAVNVVSAITVRFDEPVINVDATSFTVASSGSPISGTIAMSSTTTFVFAADADLPASATIDVTLSNAITDVAGNPLATTMFSFQTAP